MSKPINSVAWCRKGKITATKRVFTTPGAAQKAGARAADRGDRVVYSMHNVVSPDTGKRTRLYVVTTRPVASWERRAEKMDGYGH